MADEKNDDRHVNLPKVEKDNAKRLQPRTVWGLLDWKTAFSALSSLGSILEFDTVKGSRRQGREAHRANTSYTKRLSKVCPLFTGTSTVGCFCK